MENEAESLLVPEEGSGPETRLDVCPACGLNLRSRGAKLLPCLHSVCHRCWPAATRETLIRCPVCRRECAEADAMENWFVRDAVESPSSTVDGTTQLCMTCDDHSEASSFCVNCSEYLCGACVEAHRRVRLTRDHKLRPKSDAAAAEASGQRPLFCDSHRQEALKLFCETCDLLTCRDCQLLEHKDHRYQFLSDAVQSHRRHLESMAEQLQEKQRLVDEVSRSIQEGLQRVNQNRTSIRKQIRASVCSLVEQINEKEKQLMHQLEAVMREQESVLVRRQEDAADLSRRLHHVLKFAVWATSRSGSVALLHCKRLITFQMENLLQAKCSATFTPLGGVRFQCRSSYWASSVDLGSLVAEHKRDPGVPAPSSSPLSFTSRASHNTLAQLQMQVEKIDPNWPPSAPWCQSVRLPRTAPTQSRRLSSSQQPPASHAAPSLPGCGRTPQIPSKPSGAPSLQPSREALGFQVPSGCPEEYKEEKPSVLEMRQTILPLGSPVRKRRRSSPGPDLEIKKEPNYDHGEGIRDL